MHSYQAAKAAFVTNHGVSPDQWDHLELQANALGEVLGVPEGKADLFAAVMTCSLIEAAKLGAQMALAGGKGE